MKNITGKFIKPVFQYLTTLYGKFRPETIFIQWYLQIHIIIHDSHNKENTNMFQRCLYTKMLQYCQMQYLNAVNGMAI